MTMNPRREPASNVAAAGNGRKVLELFEQFMPCHPLKQAERKCSAADAATRETKRRAPHLFLAQPAIKLRYHLVIDLLLTRDRVANSFRPLRGPRLHFRDVLI